MGKDNNNTAVNADTDNGTGQDTVTLFLDDGEQEECAVLTILEVGDRNYIALLPLKDSGDSDDGEVYLYRFSQGDGNEPLLENIEDDDEFDAVADAFDEWLDTQEYDDLVFEDEEESGN